MRSFLFPVSLSMLLVGCADGGDKSPANDTDSTSSDDTDQVGTDTDDPTPTDTDSEVVAFAPLPNGSFEADVLADGDYLSSARSETFSGWTQELSANGYVSVWGGWTRDDQWGELPAPASGRQYLRLELWNQGELPADITAKVTSAPFGSVTGGTTCTLTYAVSELDYYTIPPLKVTVAWSESGSVVDNLDADVAGATGYDVNAVDGAWLQRSVPIAFPADADGQAVTVSIDASATNVTPGLSLVLLVDNVEIRCD